MKTWHWILLAVITIASVVLQFWGPPSAHPHAWDRIPAFYAIFGFGVCVIIIFVSKALGKAGLEKREDYYDE